MKFETAIRKATDDASLELIILTKSNLDPCWDKPTVSCERKSRPIRAYQAGR